MIRIQIVWNFVLIKRISHEILFKNFQKVSKLFDKHILKPVSLLENLKLHLIISDKNQVTIQINIVNNKFNSSVVVDTVIPGLRTPSF